MASVNQSTNVLPSVTHSSLGGNASAYQEKMAGGHGYGFEGKMIAPGVAEVSSYKGGRNKRRQSKRRQSKKNQRKSRKQRRSRR